MQRGEQTVRNTLTWFIIISIILASIQDITSLASPTALADKIDKDQLDSNNNINNNKITPHASQKTSQQNKQQKRLNSEFKQTTVMVIQLGQGESYQSAYNSLKQKMDFMYPQILVMSEKYPLPPIRKFLSSAISVGQTALIFIGIGGRFIPAINQHPLYQTYQQKSTWILIGGYFGLNTLQKMISAIDAFQVLLNGELIYSKLKTNRLPILQDLDRYL